VIEYFNILNKENIIQIEYLPNDFLIYKDGVDTVAIISTTGIEFARDTNSSIIIQSVLDTCGGNDCNVKFSTGDFILSTALYVHGNTTIVGSGIDKTTFVTTHTNHGIQNYASNTKKGESTAAEWDHNLTFIDFLFFQSIPLKLNLVIKISSI